MATVITLDVPSGCWRMPLSNDSRKSDDYRVKLREEFRYFLRSMLQVCPAMDCEENRYYNQRHCPPEQAGPVCQRGPLQEAEDLNGVVVDVGQVDEQVATLWWALAQQTARVARRCADKNNTTVPVVDAIRSTTGGWNVWAPVTSLASRPTTEPTYSILGCFTSTAAVVDLTLSGCNSSSSSGAGSPSIHSETMSTTPMSSPRLVREICEKYPPIAGQRPASATPQLQSYVYETSPSDAKGVQLLRYVRVSQSASTDPLPSEGQLRGSMRRPKSEIAIRKFSDSSGQQQNDDASSSVDCVQYESQDLGRDYEEPASSYSPIVVVAIDFGTTYSGYAFSFIHDPEEIHMMRKWEGGDPGIPNAKTPTVLLLKPAGQFHSFGYTARDYYHDLTTRDTRQWLYFDKFKMTLHHQKQLGRSTLIQAANKVDSLPAVTVFAHALRFFKEHALRELSDQTAIPIHNEDIRWVITVPAIWRSAAKQLMREAAYEAGLGSDRLPHQVLISLEPEAASLFCRQLKRHQLKTEKPAELQLTPASLGKPGPLKPWNRSAQRESMYVDAVLDVCPGQRYMVVDCGGGTVDITVHQVMDLDGQHLKELHRATGGPYGSIGVDLAFEQLLDNIFGSDFMNHFKTRLPASYVDLMVSFEARKRHASPYRCNPLNIALPFSLIDCFRKYRGREVEFAIRKHGDPHVRWSTQGMLRLDQEAMKSLFQPTLRAIIEHIEDVLVHPDLVGIDYLFLVGGFAESPLLQQAVRSHFGEHVTVIIPQDVSLAILKGAVLYGVNPNAITVRRSRLTYGVAVLNRFIQGRHPIEKRVVKDGIAYCKDIFDKFVMADQSVSMGERVVRSYSPARRHQRRIVLNVFSADNDDVQFVTDPGVRMFATLSLDLGFNYAVKTRREIRVTMEFGDTEIRASAVDVFSGNTIKASFDFLDDKSQ